MLFMFNFETDHWYKKIQNELIKIFFFVLLLFYYNYYALDLKMKVIIYRFESNLNGPYLRT